jgi:DNA-binding CsgD family transcriptional regulator
MAMGHVVVGRDAELAALESMLGDPSAGAWLLVLEGDPGIGKTTVWREAAGRAEARGYRVFACRAAQPESRLSFAGLGDLLAPLDSAELDRLPTPQRRGLEIALLRAEAEERAPDPRTIGTALVSLLSDLTARSPVLVAVDDVQWLDRPTARALEFAARRVEDRPVIVLVTLRVDEASAAAGLLSALSPERVRRIRLGPIGTAALYEIVRDTLGQALTRPLLTRIERASEGNPFYALEIARAVSASDSAPSGDALPVPDDVRELVSRRLRRLPASTRSELFELSALGRPTVQLVDEAALEPAVGAGVVSIRPDGRVEFSHPLFAGAVYQRASGGRRRELHRQLAERLADPEERARHLALAAEDPSEEIAAALDRGAQHAYRRGAPEAAGELAEQAMRQTPAHRAEARWERCLAAASHHNRAGDTDRAIGLAEAIVAANAPAPIRARALCLLAEVRATNTPTESIALLEEALESCGDDSALAAHAEATLALLAGAVSDPAAIDRHLGRAIELAERAGEPAALAEVLGLRALTNLVFGKGVDAALLERALALEDSEREVGFHLRPSLNVAQVYEFTGQLDRARELLLRLRDQMQARGEEADLMMTRTQLVGTSWLAGDLEGAEREAGELLRVATLTGREIFRAYAMMQRGTIRAIRGEAADARSDASEALSIAEGMGWPHGVNQARWALSLIDLTAGDAAAAVATLEPALAFVEQVGVYEWPIAMAVPDAIEALVAIGAVDRAARLTESLGELGRSYDRPWALALSWRCRALIDAEAGNLERAQASAEQSLVEHERLPMPFERARTLLVLGRVQRRRGERRAARGSLAEAIEIFDELGTRPWAGRARSELGRIGVRRAPAELTENEALAARLAASGLTNREIAATMFVSRRTVEANLARAYRKLGIRTRAELGAEMARPERRASA